jgi:hypothetical protein
LLARIDSVFVPDLEPVQKEFLLASWGSQASAEAKVSSLPPLTFVLQPVSSLPEATESNYFTAFEIGCPSFAFTLNIS